MGTKNKTTVKDKGIGAILKELRKIEEEPFVKTGFPAKTKAADDRGGFTNIDIAFQQEFGNPDTGIPERSHVRASFDENQKKYQAINDKLVGEIFDGKKTVEEVLNTMGVVIAAGIKKKISKGIAPPLKSRQGTPLWDTGQYLGSITHVVVKGSK